MKLFDKEQIVEAFSTFWTNIATLFGRNNGLATLNSKGKIPLSQIDDSLFNDHIEYVDEVPTEDIKNKIYAVPHSYTTDDNKETNTLDIIGSYTTIQSNGKYVVDDNVVLSLDGVTIGSMFVSGTTVNLYTGRDFTGLLARTVTTSAINVWNVKQTVNHRDYYCGNEAAQTVTKMANVDQVEDWFIRKEQKGAPGGVAILNADGKIPVDELSFNTLVFMGLSSNLATDIAEISELASGMFFIANAEQVYNEVTYYPGDWCIWDGTSWSRQANVNVVSSVNDKVGNVMLTGDDIPVTYEGVDDTLNNTLPKLGKVKTVNGNGPDSNGNIEVDAVVEGANNLPQHPQNKVYNIAEFESNKNVVENSFKALQGYRNNVIEEDVYLKFKDEYLKVYGSYTGTYKGKISESVLQYPDSDYPGGYYGCYIPTEKGIIAIMSFSSESYIPEALDREAEYINNPSYPYQVTFTDKNGITYSTLGNFCKGQGIPYVVYGYITSANITGYPVMNGSVSFCKKNEQKSRVFSKNIQLATKSDLDTKADSDNVVTLDVDWLTINKTNGGVLLQKDGVETARFRSKDGTISTPALKTYSDKHTNLYGDLKILNGSRIQLYPTEDTQNGAEGYVAIDNLAVAGFDTNPSQLKWEGIDSVLTLSDRGGYIKCPDTIELAAWDGRARLKLGSISTSLHGNETLHLTADTGGIDIDESISIYSNTGFTVTANSTVEINAGGGECVKFQNGLVQINEYGSIEVRNSSGTSTIAEIDQNGTGRFQKLDVNDDIFIHPNSYEGGGYIHMGKPRYYDSNVDAHGLLNERINNGITIECNDAETAGIHINGDGILMYAPPDDYALNIINEDTGESIFKVDNSGVYFKGNKIS